MISDDLRALERSALTQRVFIRDLPATVAAQIRDEVLLPDYASEYALPPKLEARYGQAFQTPDPDGWKQRNGMLVLPLMSTADVGGAARWQDQASAGARKARRWNLEMGPPVPMFFDGDGPGSPILRAGWFARIAEPQLEWGSDGPPGPMEHGFSFFLKRDHADMTVGMAQTAAVHQATRLFVDEVWFGHHEPYVRFALLASLTAAREMCFFGPSTADALQLMPGEFWRRELGMNKRESVTRGGKK